MSKINVRGLFGKDIMPDLSPDKIAELEKLRLDIERLRIQNGPNQETRQCALWTRLIVIIVSLIVTSLLLGVIVPPITKSITQYQILKLGYQDVCDDYINIDIAKKLYEDKFKTDIFKAGGILVNGNIVNTKKDTVIIKQVITQGNK